MKSGKIFEYQLQRKNKFNDWDIVSLIGISKRNDNIKFKDARVGDRIVLLIINWYNTIDNTDLQNIITIKYIC